MTKDDLIRMADLVGYDVDDDDDVHAPAAGRYGLDPRLEHFAQLVSKLVRQDEREACLVILETYPTVLEMIKAIRKRT
jgi:hypothetical protein